MMKRNLNARLDFIYLVFNRVFCKVIICYNALELLQALQSRKFIRVD